MAVRILGEPHMIASKKNLLATAAPHKSIPQENATAKLRRQREAAVQPAAQSAVHNDRRNADRDGGDDADADAAGRDRDHKPHLANRLDEVLASPEAEGADDDLITTLALANWFNVSQQWCELGRTKNYGPPFIRLGPQVVRYHRGTVREWLTARIHSSTAEYSTKREEVK